MADSVYYYNGATTTVTGSYTAASPLVTDIALPTVYLHSIRVRMPPGPCGNLGFAFYNANAQIIPYSLTPSFVTGDDEVWNFDYEDQVGVQLDLHTYNTGTYNHELLYEIRYTPIAAYISNPGDQLPVAQVAEVAILPEANVFQVPGSSVGE